MKREARKAFYLALVHRQPEPLHHVSHSGEDLFSWTYPVSVDSVGLGDWFDGSPIQFASMTLAAISPAARGGAVDC